MEAIWIILITRVLSWPVAAVILGLIFKRHIRGLLARATHLSLKHGETSLEAHATNAALDQIDQTRKLDPASLDAAPVGTVNTTVVAASTAENRLDIDTNARQAAIDFGKGIEAVAAREIAIREHLARLNFPLNEQTTTEILIRNLAFNQALAGAERLYRLIFGSQIALLRFLNSMGPKADTELKPFYERARKRFGKFYSGYSYESWRQFLLDQRVMVRDEKNGTYGINQQGRDFLAWMAAQGLTEEKAG